MFVEYVVDTVLETVDFALGRSQPGKVHRRTTSADTSFPLLVNNIFTRLQIGMPVVLVTLAYLDRAKSHLYIGPSQWAHERVFLGALMVASKVCHHVRAIFHSSNPPIRTVRK